MSFLHHTHMLLMMMMRKSELKEGMKSELKLGNKEKIQL
jgi:hypothetical protein